MVLGTRPRSGEHGKKPVVASLAEHSMSPHWSDNFNLDNGAAVLGETFDVVAVDRTRGTFEFPDPGPVLAWVQSLRPGLQRAIYRMRPGKS